MELVKLGDKTYYIKNNTNIGIYKIGKDEVIIIDTGNDSDAGKKIDKIIKEQNWKIKGIINTHSHADHIGGNRILQDKNDLDIYGEGIEKAFCEYPILEPAYLYGSKPFKDLENKFLEAKSTKITKSLEELPEGLEYFNLPGHTYQMIGIKTSDNIYFLGDSIINIETIQKYHLFYIYDVKEYLNTLDYLETLEGKYFIPAHGEIKENLKDLIKLNRDKILEIKDKILEICRKEIIFEDILKEIFTSYNLVLNLIQYMIVGSTIKAYLSYLYDEDKLEIVFKDNQMLWKVKEN